MFQRVQPSIPSLPSIPSSSISNQPVSSSSAGRVMDHSHLVCCYTAHVTLQWYVFVCLCVRVCVCVCVCVRVSAQRNEKMGHNVQAEIPNEQHRRHSAPYF